MNGNPAVVRLRGRVVMASLVMLGLVSATAGDETFETSTPNGLWLALASELIRTVRFGKARRDTAGEISIRSTGNGAGPKGKGSTLRPICVGELGAELIDIVDANEMSRSDER